MCPKCHAEEEKQIPYWDHHETKPESSDIITLVQRFCNTTSPSNSSQDVKVPTPSLVSKLEEALDFLRSRQPAWAKFPFLEADGAKTCSLKITSLALQSLPFDYDDERTYSASNILVGITLHTDGIDSSSSPVLLAIILGRILHNGNITKWIWAVDLLGQIFALKADQIDPDELEVEAERQLFLRYEWMSYGEGYTLPKPEVDDVPMFDEIGAIVFHLGDLEILKNGIGVSHDQSNRQPATDISSGCAVKDSHEFTGSFDMHCMIANSSFQIEMDSHDPETTNVQSPADFNRWKVSVATKDAGEPSGLEESQSIVDTQNYEPDHCSSYMSTDSIDNAKHVMGWHGNDNFCVSPSSSTTNLGSSSISPRTPSNSKSSSTESSPLQSPQGHKFVPLRKVTSWSVVGILEVDELVQFPQPSITNLLKELS